MFTQSSVFIFNIGLILSDDAKDILIESSLRQTNWVQFLFYCEQSFHVDVQNTRSSYSLRPYLFLCDEIKGTMCMFYAEIVLGVIQKGRPHQREGGLPKFGRY